MGQEIERAQSRAPDEIVEVLTGVIEEQATYFRWEVWRDPARNQLHISYRINDEWFHRCSPEQHDRLNKLLLALRDLSYELPQR